MLNFIIGIIVGFCIVKVVRIIQNYLIRRQLEKIFSKILLDAIKEEENRQNGK